MSALLAYTRDTNDTLRLASKVVAMVVAAAEQRVHALEAAVGQKRPRHGDCVSNPSSALLKAWLPFRYVHKALWWECTRSPEEEEEEEDCEQPAVHEGGSDQDHCTAAGASSSTTHACHSQPPESFAAGTLVLCFSTAFCFSMPIRCMPT